MSNGLACTGSFRRQSERSSFPSSRQAFASSSCPAASQACTVLPHAENSACQHCYSWGRRRWQAQRSTSLFPQKWQRQRSRWKRWSRRKGRIENRSIEEVLDEAVIVRYTMHCNAYSHMSSCAHPCNIVTATDLKSQKPFLPYYRSRLSTDDTTPWFFLFFYLWKSIQVHVLRMEGRPIINWNHASVTAIKPMEAHSVLISVSG